MKPRDRRPERPGQAAGATFLTESIDIETVDGSSTIAPLTSGVLAVQLAPLRREVAEKDSLPLVCRCDVHVHGLIVKVSAVRLELGNHDDHEAAIRRPAQLVGLPRIGVGVAAEERDVGGEPRAASLVLTVVLTGAGRMMTPPEGALMSDEHEHSDAWQPHDEGQPSASEPMPSHARPEWITYVEDGAEPRGRESSG